VRTGPSFRRVGAGNGARDAWGHRKKEEISRPLVSSHPTFCLPLSTLPEESPRRLNTASFRVAPGEERRSFRSG